MHHCVSTESFLISVATIKWRCFGFFRSLRTKEKRGSITERYLHPPKFACIHQQLETQCANSTIYIYKIAKRRIYKYHFNNFEPYKFCCRLKQQVFVHFADLLDNSMASTEFQRNLSQHRKIHNPPSVSRNTKMMEANTTLTSK